jgi:hypothetical protein
MLAAGHLLAQSMTPAWLDLNCPNSRYSLARRSRYPGEAGWYLGADRRRLVAGQGAEVCGQVAGGRFSVPGDWVGARGHDADGGLEAHLRDGAGVVLGGGEEEFAAYVGEREGGLYGRVGARSQAFIMVTSWMVGAGEGGIPRPLRRCWTPPKPPAGPAARWTGPLPFSDSRHDPETALPPLSGSPASLQ